MLDAYTVRKAVPRIIIAAIAINLSIYLCVMAVDIVNIIGHGLSNLVVAPFLDQNKEFRDLAIQSNTTNNIAGVMGLVALISGVGGALVFPGAAATLAAGAALALLPIIGAFLISAFLIVIAVVFTIILRQAIIIFLIISSPIAIALLVLPGTEKYFKKWLDLFVTTLMVYPIISAIFAMSTVFTTILIGTAAKSPDAIGLAKLLAAIVVAFAPLIMIPFAFRLAGGAISTIMTAGAGRGRTLAGSARKGMQSMRDNQNTAYGKAYSENKSSRINKGLSGRQIWASRLGGGAEARAERKRSARSLDDFIQRSTVQDSYRFKAKGEDSDVLDSLVMTEDQVAKDRKFQQETIRDNSAILNNVRSSAKAKQEAQNKIYAAQRALDAHSDADMIGRNTQTAQAAFNNASRIKFTQNSHSEEIDIARRLYGEEGAAEAMNAHQAIAKGPAMRPDLSGSLYSQSYDLDRATSSQSTYTLMNQARPDAIKNLIDGHMGRLRDSTSSDEEKARSAAWLTAVKSSKGSGTEANNQVIVEKMDGIDKEVNKYITDQGRLEAAASPSHLERMVEVQRPNPSAPGEMITTRETQKAPLTDPAQIKAWGEAQAKAKLQQRAMGYYQPNPRELEEK